MNEIKSALRVANAEYAKTEKRKVYSEHVLDGKKEGVKYENTMPHGEDRDGDRKIDTKDQVRAHRKERRDSAPGGRPPF